MKTTPYKRCFARKGGEQFCQDHYDFVWDNGTGLDKTIPVKYEFEDGTSSDDFECTILFHESKLM